MREKKIKIKNLSSSILKLGGKISLSPSGEDGDERVFKSLGQMKPILEVCRRAESMGWLKLEAIGREEKPEEEPQEKDEVSPPDSQEPGEENSDDGDDVVARVREKMESGEVILSDQELLDVYSKRSGSWYTLPGGVKVQGEDNALEALRELEEENRLPDSPLSGE